MIISHIILDTFFNIREMPSGALHRNGTRRHAAHSQSPFFGKNTGSSCRTKVLILWCISGQGSNPVVKIERSSPSATSQALVPANTNSTGSGLLSEVDGLTVKNVDLLNLFECPGMVLHINFINNVSLTIFTNFYSLF